MAEKAQQNKGGKSEKTGSGVGKFFLGAAIGAAAGFVASKFVSAKMSKDGGEEIDDDDDDLIIEGEIKCECGDKCKSDKAEKKIAAEKTEKKPAEKPAAKAAEKSATKATAK